MNERDESAIESEFRAGRSVVPSQTVLRRRPVPASWKANGPGRWSYVRTFGALRVFCAALMMAATSVIAAAQTAPPAPPDTTDPQSARPAEKPPEQTPPASTREAAIEQEQAAKDQKLHPYIPNKAEEVFNKLDTILQGGQLRWHPFFTSAYSGGGFTLGAGRTAFVSGYNFLDARASWTFKNYKRVEAAGGELVARRIFNRRGRLSVLGGWREATQVGFYGIGTNTSKDNRTNYLFKQPYGSALLTVFPTRGILMLEGGAEISQWTQE